VTIVTKRSKKPISLRLREPKAVGDKGHEATQRKDQKRLPEWP
jgi:hypothetical protein